MKNRPLKAILILVNHIKGILWIVIYIVFVAGFYQCKSTTDKKQNYQIRSWHELPIETKDIGKGNLWGDANQLTLIFTEYINDTIEEIRIIHLQPNGWSTSLNIQSGDRFFTNWADFPSIARFRNSERNMAVHWLQYSGNETYEYDIRIAISNNNGRSWKPSFLLHQDGVLAEHGFVSMVPVDTVIFAIWLNGRRTNSSNHTSDQHQNGRNDDIEDRV